MREKCKNCLQPSKSCIPFLMTLSTNEMLEWCRFWKERLGWSNATMAKKSNVPIGTIGRVMCRAKPDGEKVGVKLVTIRPIICAITGCTIDELESCEPLKDAAREALMERVVALEEDNARLKREATNQRTFLAAQISEKDKQVHLKDRYIGVLAIAFGVALLCLAAYILSDLRNPAWGILWKA